MIKNCISVMSHAFNPLPPVTNCHTFSDPLPRDVLYGRPQKTKDITMDLNKKLAEISYNWWIIIYMCRPTLYSLCKTIVYYQAKIIGYNWMLKLNNLCIFLSLPHTHTHTHTHARAHTHMCGVVA